LIDATTNIVSFIKAYDVCEKLINDPDFFRNPHQCYSDIVNYRNKILNNISLPFSRNLVDKTNEMFSTLRTWRHLEAKRKTEYNEIDRINKNKLTERARAVFFAAQESAFENLSYRKAEIICLACGCIADKKASEIGIARERQYSKKYGVTNLSVIDNYKRNIMSNDACIKENKAAYYKLTNHSFTTLLCKSENSCEDTTENLRRKLMRDIIDKEPVEIRSLVYKEHGFLNEQN